MAKEAAVRTDQLLSDIKQKEARMQEIREPRTHIINYSKTRDIYAAYRKAGTAGNSLKLIGRRSHCIRRRKRHLISWS